MMALVYGYVRDLDIAVPLRRQVRIQDPRDMKEYEAWEIALDEMEEVFWPKLLADMRSRFKDAPTDDVEFRKLIMAQGGLPIRSERIDLVYDIRGFL